MELLDRVVDNPFICRVELAFDGTITPSIIPGWQQFYNSSLVDAQFHKATIGLGTVAFGEESNTSAAGTSYKQSLSIQFNSTDGKRAERIALINKAKFIKVHLTNGKNFVLGRNDYKQNCRPRIKTKTNQKVAEIEFETVSMFPTGFMAQDANSLFVQGLIPIILE
jgi:hypothetical protein